MSLVWLWVEQISKQNEIMTRKVFPKLYNVSHCLYIVLIISGMDGAGTAGLICLAYESAIGPLRLPRMAAREGRGRELSVLIREHGRVSRYQWMVEKRVLHLWPDMDLKGRFV